MQYLLGICALGALLAVASLLPETAHAKSREWRFVNPLAPLGLLRSPNILALVSSHFIYHDAWADVHAQSFVGTFTLLANFGAHLPLFLSITHHASCTTPR